LHLKNSDDNGIYWLRITDYPTEKISSDFSKREQEKFLRLEASTLIMMIGKQLSEERISLNNYSGIYSKGVITQQSKGELIYVKVFLVKSRIYQLMTSCLPEKKDNPSIKAFFDSFELIEN
jgi:hypothetical protein